MDLTVIMIFLAAGCGGFGYVLGKIHERMEWDLLIRQGKLPRPGATWRYN